MGMTQAGQRTQRLIPYDETFRMLTLPTTRKGTAKVMPQLGIKINALCYWSDALLDLEVENTQAPFVMTLLMLEWLTFSSKDIGFVSFLSIILCLQGVLNVKLH